MGFLNIPKWINDNMSGTDGIIYSVIYNASKEQQFCDLSTSKMAEIVNKSVITVKRTLKKLEKTEAIKRIGYNQYKNVKYVPLLNENNILSWVKTQKDTKYQNDTMQSIKVSKYQSIKMIPPSYQNDTMQSIKMIPYNNISLNKDINIANKRGISINTNSQKATAFPEFGGNKKMLYSWYKENSYDKFEGWWKHYIFFEDDEELNDLFIKFLDKTAADNNGYNDGCRIAFDLINIARSRSQYSDEELFNMSDAEMELITNSELEPIDQTEELKRLLKDFAYNGNKQPLFEFIGIE